MDACEPECSAWKCSNECSRIRADIMRPWQFAGPPKSIGTMSVFRSVKQLK